MRWLDALLIPYVLVLLFAPALIRRRWGLTASLVVVVVELSFVAVVYYFLEFYHVFPDSFAGKPAPREPFEILRRAWERHAAALVDLYVWGVLPAIAVLIGGALCLLIRRTTPPQQIGS
jgi:glucan phosphoethanolaminetransferase (alkaline phosphatase superfamily)